MSRIMGARSGKVAIAALEHPHAGLRQRRRMPLSIPRYLASQLTTDGANAVALAAREISLATVTRVCPPSHAGTESRHRIACASLSNASSEAHKERGKPSPSSSVAAQRQRRLSSGSRRGSRCRHRSRSKRKRRSARGRVSDSSGRYSAGCRVNDHDCSCCGRCHLELQYFIRRGGQRMVEVQAGRAFTDALAVAASCDTPQRSHPQRSPQIDGPHKWRRPDVL